MTTDKSRADALTERDPSKASAEQGLFRKFDVRRTDGSDAPGGKHHDCEYFVLDMNHDRHARDALRVYARACAAEFPVLTEHLNARYALEPFEQHEAAPPYTDVEGLEFESWIAKLLDVDIGVELRDRICAKIKKLKQHEAAPAAWKSPKQHCQNGGDVCLAGNRDSVCCPEDSCDIDDGVRKNPIAQPEPPVADERAAFLTWWCDDVPEDLREGWKEGVDESLRRGRATDRLVGAWEGFQFGVQYARASSPNAAVAEGALGYAQRLATGLWEKHWRDSAPQWKVLDDTLGVLTQIDNMVCDLQRAPAQAAEPVAIYQLQQVNGAWRDVSESEYHAIGKNYARTVYASPPLPATASAPVGMTDEQVISAMDDADCVIRKLGPFDTPRERDLAYVRALLEGAKQ
jgi:hypothetical protein